MGSSESPNSDVAQTEPMTVSHVQTTRHHVPVLDGLRAVACLLVIVAHLPFKFFLPEAKIIDQILRPGYLGVGLFFVLSGFLITRILMYNREKGVSLKSFYIKRSARIFPIYYLTILAVALLQPGTYLWFHALYLNNIPYFFGTGANPIGHSWSLAVEEHFYLAWPLVITFIPLKWLQLAIVKIAAIGFGLAFLFPFFVQNREIAQTLVESSTPTQMSSLAIGGWLAWKEKDLQIIARSAWKWTLLGAVILNGSTYILHQQDNPYMVSVRYLAFVMLATSIFTFALTLKDSSRLSKFLSKGVMPSIGRVSYGLYLYHFPIFFFTGTLFGEGNLLTWTTATISVFALSYASYGILESRMITWAAAKAKAVA